MARSRYYHCHWTVFLHTEPGLNISKISTCPAYKIFFSRWIIKRLEENLAKIHLPDSLFYLGCRAMESMKPYEHRRVDLKCLEQFTNVRCAQLLSNRPISQMPQSICPISCNAPFRKEMCTFLFWMVHCGIWDMCIVGFVNLVYCRPGNEHLHLHLSILHSKKSSTLTWLLFTALFTHTFRLLSPVLDHYSFVGTMLLRTGGVYHELPA